MEDVVGDEATDGKVISRTFGGSQDGQSVWERESADLGQKHEKGSEEMLYYIAVGIAELEMAQYSTNSCARDDAYDAGSSYPPQPNGSNIYNGSQECSGLQKRRSTSIIMANATKGRLEDDPRYSLLEDRPCMTFITVLNWTPC